MERFAGPRVSYKRDLSGGTNRSTSMFWGATTLLVGWTVLLSNQLLRALVSDAKRRVATANPRDSRAVTQS